MIKKHLSPIKLLIIIVLLFIIPSPIMAQILEVDSPGEIAANQDAEIIYNEGVVKLIQDNDMHAALNKFSEAVKLKPELDKAWYNIAYIQYKREEYALAENNFSQAIKINPAGIYYFGRGLCRFNTNNIDLAEADFIQAINVDPKLSMAHYYLGACYFLNNNFEKAIESYTSAIAIDNNFAFAYNDRGIACFKLKKYAEAIKDFSRAAELKSDLPFIFNNLGAAQMMANQQAAARINLDIISSNLANAGIASINNIAILKSDKGETDTAIIYLQKCINKNPEYIPALINLGIAKYRNKDYKGAVSCFSETIKIDPDNAIAYLNRGIAKEMARDPKGSCEDWKKAAALGIQIANEYVKNQCK